MTTIIADHNNYAQESSLYLRRVAGDLRERADRIDQQVARIDAVRKVMAGEHVDGFSPLPEGIASVFADTARSVTDIVTHSPSQLGFVNYLLASAAAAVVAQGPA